MNTVASNANAISPPIQLASQDGIKRMFGPIRQQSFQYFWLLVIRYEHDRVVQHIRRLQQPSHIYSCSISTQYGDGIASKLVTDHFHQTDPIPPQRSNNRTNRQSMNARRSIACIIGFMNAALIVPCSSFHMKLGGLNRHGRQLLLSSREVIICCWWLQQEQPSSSSDAAAIIAVSLSLLMLFCSFSL